MCAYVAVAGAGTASAEERQAAEDVGRLIAQAGAVLVCGGLGGVMEAASRGAKSAGGTTIGILPGHERKAANEHVDIAIATGLGEMRNGLVVRSADVLIAVGGEFGTLSEIALALKAGKPVIGLATWQLARDALSGDPVIQASSPEDAVKRALAACGLP
jgi:uncharacterized protein (TIGR00725 family)